jgi:hypothetical protein
MIARTDELARPSSIGSFQSDESLNMDVSPINQSPVRKLRKKSGFLRRDTVSSESSEEEGGKTSTLERIVRGLARLGSTQTLRKAYDSDLGGSDEDIKMRYD